MAITEFTDDLGIIAALDDEPNDTGGLTAAQLKAKFDEGPKAIQTYINDTLLPVMDGANIPYDNSVEGGQTIKEALDSVTVGVMPDNSITNAKLVDNEITFAKLDDTAIASEAEAVAGTATNKLMTPQRVEQAISGKYAIGSYVGTGTYGASNPNTVTVDFQPKFMIILTTSREVPEYPYICNPLFIYPSTIYAGMKYNPNYSAGEDLATGTAIWGENTISWYSTELQYIQCNALGVTYYYLIRG